MNIPCSDENKKFTYITNASYSQIRKIFKVFKSNTKRKKTKQHIYSIFKEYDINSFEKNRTKYAVVSIPYKNGNAATVRPVFIQTLKKQMGNDFL